MTNATKMKNAERISDLELYELVVAMYPEKFAERDEAGDDLWDEVMEFVEDDLVGELLCTEDGLRALLGRVLLLTHPIRSGISGELYHALGTVEIKGDVVHMLAHAKAKIAPEQPGTTIAGLRVTVDETMPPDAFRIVNARPQRFPCWSCKEPVSLSERADHDGNCPHCSAELDLETWPKKEA
jgi:hypothetical protein